MAEIANAATETLVVGAKESPLVVVLRFIVDRVARLIASGSNFDRSEWADLLAFRATCHELRDALWNELQGVRASNAGYADADRYMPSALEGRTDYPAALESLLFLSHIRWRRRLAALLPWRCRRFDAVLRRGRLRAVQAAAADEAGGTRVPLPIPRNANSTSGKHLLSPGSTQARNVETPGTTSRTPLPGTSTSS